MAAQLARLRRAKERFAGDSSVASPAPSSPREPVPEFRTPGPIPASPTSPSRHDGDKEILMLQLERQRHKVEELEQELQSQFGVSPQQAQAGDTGYMLAYDKAIKEKKDAQLRVLQLEDQKRAWEAGARVVVTDSSADLVASLTTENDSLRRSVNKLKAAIEDLEANERQRSAEQDELRSSASAAQEDLRAVTESASANRSVWEQLVREEKEEGVRKLQLLEEQHQRDLAGLNRQLAEAQNQFRESQEDCEWLQASLEQSHRDVSTAQDKTHEQSTLAKKLRLKLQRVATASQQVQQQALSLADAFSSELLAQQEGMARERQALEEARDAQVQLKSDRIVTLEHQCELLEAQLSDASGLAQAQEHLKEQMAQLVEEHQQAMQAAALQREGLQHEIDSLQTQIDALKEKLALAASRAAQAKVAAEEMELALQKSKREVLTLQQERADSQAALERALEDGSMIRKELQLQKDLNTTVSSRDCLQSSRMEQLQQQLRTCEQQSQAEQAEQQATIAALRVELEVDRATVTRIKKLAQMHQQETASLSESVSTLQAELEAARKAEQQAGQLLAEERSSLQEQLQAQTLDSTSKLEQLEHRVQELEAEVSTREDVARELQRELLESRSGQAREGQAAAAAALLEEQLKRSQERLEQLQQVQEENDTLTNQIHLLEAQAREQTAQLHLLQDSEGTATESAAANQIIIAKLRQERAEIEEEFSIKIERYERTQKAHVDAHNAELARLTSVAEQLQEQLEQKEQREASFRVEVSESRSQVNELKQLLSERDRELNERDSGSKRQAQEQAAGFEELHQANARLAAEKAELLEATNAALEAGERAEKRSKELHALNKQLSEDMEGVSEQLVQQVETVEALRDSEQALRSELVQAQQELAEARSSYTHLSSTVSKEAQLLESEANDRRARLRQAEEARVGRPANLSPPVVNVSTVSAPNAPGSPISLSNTPSPREGQSGDKIWASPLAGTVRERIVESSLNTPSPHIRSLSERSPGFARLQALAKELESPGPQ